MARVPSSPSSPECMARRELILDAATRLFAEHGYVEADTQRLADEMGIGKGTLYRHFPSKRELFLAAADRVMRRLHDRLVTATDGVDDPLEQVRRLVNAYVGYFRDEPEALEILIQERAQFKDRERPTYLTHREKHIERRRDLYRGLIADGRVRPMPAERITDVLSAALYGSLFLDHFGDGSGGCLAASPADILDVFLHGILSDTERRAAPAVAGPDAPAPRSRSKAPRARTQTP